MLDLNNTQAIWSTLSYQYLLIINHVVVNIPFNRLDPCHYQLYTGIAFSFGKKGEKKKNNYKKKK